MRRAFAVTLFMFIVTILHSQVVINEFMAGNTKTLMDEQNEYEDWIEIYNPGETSVNLDGYYITDNFNNPVKFAFPSGLTIGAKGFIVLFADEDQNQGSLHTNFKLSSSGEEIAIFKITVSDTLLIDSLSFGEQVNDVSYGRFPDGNSYMELLSTPTPNASNISGNLLGLATPPVFSISGGFYSGQQYVELSTLMAGAEIRYTTDGSEPTATSPLYNGSIISDTTFILKAFIQATNYLPSKVIANTYFIGEHFIAFSESERLPVISLACDKYKLYGSQGIITNYESDIEQMASVELFEPNGTNSINQYCGLKIYGNASRQMEQKSIAAFARSKYGNGNFNYKFFNDKPFDKYESFVMRNGGSDWSLTYFRDALCQSLVKGRMNFDAQGSQHAICYINGKFYGIVDLKEKINEHFVEMNCNANANNIDMLSDDATLIYGSVDNYQQFKYFITRNDMNDEFFYGDIEKMMDIENYRDWQIAQIYIANIDMFLNSKYWRDKGNYSKWRWIMYDTELSFGQGDYSYTSAYGTSAFSNTLDFATNNFGASNWPFLQPWSIEKLISLLNNESFRNDFIQTFAAHINTTFKTSRVLAMIDSMQNRVRNEIPYQIATYGGHEVVFNPYGIHFSTIAEWEHYVDTMRYFAIHRPDYMRSFIIEKFEIPGTYNFTITSDNPSYGSYFIQGVSVPVDSSGLYFDNIPLNISVKANPGYKFVRWEGSGITNPNSSEISLNLSEDKSIKAIFEPENDVMITEILYNSEFGSDNEFIEIYNPKHATPISLKKCSLSGSISFTFPDSTVIQPQSYITIAFTTDDFNHNFYQLYEWTSGTLNDTTGYIVLRDSLGLIIDSVNYFNENPWPVASENYSVELTSIDADNNDGSNWKEGSFWGTPGIPTNNDGIEFIKINEFLADNETFYPDKNFEYNDWIELINTGNDTVDIGGLLITNDLSNPFVYQVPTNIPEVTTMAPGNYLIIWADNDKEQGPLHAGFKLDAAGGTIGLSADGKTFFESVTYSAQTTDVSLGRHVNGTGNWTSFKVPTPGLYNNYAPVFESLAELTVPAGEPYEYNIVTTDADGDYLYMNMMTKPYWLIFTNNGDGTGSLKGTMPLNALQSHNVKIYVTDGNSLPIVQSFNILKGDRPSFNKESFALNTFECYPNPSEGLIHIKTLTESPEVQLVISNIAGQQILSKKLLSTDGYIFEEIDLTGENKGLYYITITSNEYSVTKKVILF